MATTTTDRHGSRASRRVESKREAARLIRDEVAAWRLTTENLQRVDADADTGE